jgi:hypothetical protein
MVRRFTVAVSTIALVGGFAFTVGPMSLFGAQAAARGAFCSLSGTAAISPGLGTTAKTQKITFSGVKLSDCLQGSLASPSVPKLISGTVTISPSPVTATASCVTGKLSGLTATIAWSTGTKTTATINTTSVTGETLIQGKVSSSTNPSLKPGDLVEGDAVFRPTSTSMNCVKVPVTAVTFNGAIGTGSPTG